MIDFYPLQLLDLTGIGMGGAVMIVGLLGLTLWAAVKFRNPMAIVMWGLTTMTLIIVAMYEIRDEIFWFGLMITIILITVGVTARAVNS